MVVAVPLLGDRVAPRCTTADRLLLISLRGRRADSQAILDVEVDGVESLLGIIGSRSVRVVVCGGITGSARERLEARGVRVIDNVAGSVAEVLAAVHTGTLRSGFGFGTGTGAPAPGPGAGGPAQLDCLACADPACERGLPCPRLSAGAGPAKAGRTVQRLLLVGAVACPGAEDQCRVAQLVRFCLRAGFGHVGVAFCRDLLPETGVLAGILRGYFRVSPVSCAVRDRHAPRFPDAPPGHRCNALLQARTLNQAGTDINIVVGLDVGADAVFAAASRSPVSTLIVKDVALGHNPMAALHSGHYVRQCSPGGRDEPPGQ